MTLISLPGSCLPQLFVLSLRMMVLEIRFVKFLRLSEHGSLTYRYYVLLCDFRFFHFRPSPFHYNAIEKALMIYFY